MKKLLIFTRCASLLIFSNTLLSMDVSSNYCGKSNSFKKVVKIIHKHVRPVYTDGVIQAAAAGVLSGIAHDTGFIDSTNAQRLSFGLSAGIVGLYENKDSLLSLGKIWRNVAGTSAAVSRGCVALGTEQLWTAWRQGTLSNSDSQLAIGQSLLLSYLAYLVSEKLDGKDTVVKIDKGKGSYCTISSINSWQGEVDLLEKTELS